MSRLFFIIGFVFLFNSLFTQNLSVDFILHNNTSDTAIIGTLFGTRQMAIDSLKRNGNTLNWAPRKEHPPGIYFLWLKPENIFVQFLVNGKDNTFSLEMDLNYPKETTVTGSLDNRIFHDYLKFLGENQTLQDSLQTLLNKAKEENAPFENFEASIESIRKGVEKYKKEVSINHKGSLTAFLLKGSLEPEVPAFDTGDEKENQALSYYYYRDHYFDNVDFSHPALMRSAFIQPKIHDYIHKVSYLHPDSMKISIDVVMEKLEINPEAHRYFLADLLNSYSRMTIAGQDALYVHLVDNYYNKGKAAWVGERNIDKINAFANTLRPSLLGNIMVDFIVYKEDGTPVRLHEIEADYTVLFFWDPTCAHCKKVFPKVKDFHTKYGKEGYIEVVTICSKGGERYPKCWEYLHEYGYNNLFNTGDEFQRYNEIHRFNKFPKAIILDRNKKVLMKDFNPDNLESVFNNVISKI